MENLVEVALNNFHKECRDLIHHSCTVREIEVNTADPKWPLCFYRDYVSKNIPVVIKNGCRDFPATQKWGIDYFRKCIPNKEVTVAITPNGYADGLAPWKNPETGQTEEIFILPEERVMAMDEFLKNIDDPKDNFICYIQKQNSNFTEDFHELFNDISCEMNWASEAFDKKPEPMRRLPPFMAEKFMANFSSVKPDAVNFWMGDSRAITSMHRDFYENIYCVIEGYKNFILIPPTDLPHITYRDYKIGQYCNVSENDYKVNLCTDENGDIKTVPWIAVDPLKPDLENFLKFSNANCYKVRVKKGDCLYLPSVWFHHVQQSHGCVAVNYWYDMDFDVKFCYYKLLESLTEL